MPGRPSRTNETITGARIQSELDAAARVGREIAEAGPAPLTRGVRLWTDTLGRGGKILLCGNGGSAADSQHAAAELVVKLRKVRRALPAIALTTDTSILTAGANDLGFDHVFGRQVEALGNAGDLLVAISTSGRSKNILKAVDVARRRRLKTMALTGREPNPLARRCHLTLSVDTADTQRIQEVHILFLHILCGQAERLLQTR